MILSFKTGYNYSSENFCGPQIGKHHFLILILELHQTLILPITLILEPHQNFKSSLNPNSVTS